MKIKHAIWSAVAVVALSGGGAAAAASVATAQPQHSLDQLRHATDKFHSIAVAEQNKYGLLTDVDGIACIDMPGMGGMGVHWANSLTTLRSCPTSPRPWSMPLIGTARCAWPPSNTLSSKRHGMPLTAPHPRCSATRST